MSKKLGYMDYLEETWRGLHDDEIKCGKQIIVGSRPSGLSMKPVQVFDHCRRQVGHDGDCSQYEEIKPTRMKSDARR